MIRVVDACREDIHIYLGSLRVRHMPSRIAYAENMAIEACPLNASPPSAAYDGRLKSS